MPISRRDLLVTSALPFAALPQELPRRPNVLLIMTDDQGFGDLSLYGNKFLRTPNMDAIANAGAQLTQFQVCPVCSPTRASLLTGRYNYRTGVVDTYLGRSMMYPEEVTMAEYLAGAGYRTGIFGKWHLGDNYPLRAIDQGFQESVICRGGGVGQPADPAGNSYFDPKLQHNNVEQQYRGYCTDIFFREAMDFIGKQRQQDPWFCYLSTNAPHDPLQIADEYVRPFTGKGLDDATAKTYGMIANIDENLGRLLSKLRAINQERDTILIFLTDNGPQRDRFNAGLRGRKGTVYQGGIQVPCLVRYSRQVKAGTKIDRAAAHIDLLPTILELCGVTRKKEQPAFDGRSLAPLLRGRTAGWTDRTLFTQWHRGDEPVLFRDCAARTQRYKLVNGEELYDLTQDPGERSNIAAAQPAIAKRLRDETEAWFKDVSATRGYTPPRIHIGASEEPVAVLTRQDWRGPKATWSADGLGHWEVQVARSARYRFRLEMPPVKEKGIATLHVGGKSAVIAIPAGATDVIFEGVELRAGPARVEAWIDAGGQQFGPHYVAASQG